MLIARAPMAPHAIVAMTNGKDMGFVMFLDAVRYKLAIVCVRAQQDLETRTLEQTSSYTLHHVGTAEESQAGMTRYQIITLAGGRI